MGKPGKSKDNHFSYSSYAGVEFKEEEGEFYTEGFVATTHPDRVAKDEFKGDILTANCITGIVKQINDRKGMLADFASISHDWVRKKDPSIPPIGRAVLAEVREMPGGHSGAWVKTHHDKTHPAFDETKYKVEHGYYPGYSIEFKPEEWKPIDVGTDKFRLVNGVDMFGYGLAQGRMIGNPEAALAVAGYKELMNFNAYQDIQFKEGGKKMGEAEDKKAADEAAEKKAAEEKAAEEKKAAEAAAEGKPPEGDSKPGEAAKPEGKAKPDEEEEEEAKKEVDAKQYERFQKFVAMELKDKKKDELKVQFKELLTDKTFLKEIGLASPSNAPRFTDGVELKELYASVEYKEWKGIPDKEVSVKEAFNRATAYAEKTGAMKRWGRGQMNNPIMHMGEEGQKGLSGIQIKCGGNFGEMIELKALETDTNKETDTDYLQSAAELSDIYGPAIAKMLNLRTTWFGLIPKEDWSGRSFIQWRAENVANTSGGFVFEGGSVTKGKTTRQKLMEHFKYFNIGVQVTGQMIASAQSGIGNIYQKELEAAARKALSQMNVALFAEKGAFTDEEFLGLEYLADSTGNTTLYGLTRSTTNLLGAAGSEYAAQSSAKIKKSTLRTATRTLEINGADINDLMFICHPLQRDLVLGLLDDAQRFASTIPRAGFEGMPTFDSFPIHSDKDVNNDDIFCVSLGPGGMRLAVQVPLTYEDLAKSDDSRSGFLKFYGNQYCEIPKHACYMIQGLATS